MIHLVSPSRQLSPQNGGESEREAMKNWLQGKTIKKPLLILTSQMQHRIGSIMLLSDGGEATLLTH